MFKINYNIPVVLDYCFQVGVFSSCMVTSSKPQRREEENPSIYMSVCVEKQVITCDGKWQSCPRAPREKVGSGDETAVSSAVVCLGKAHGENTCSIRLSYTIYVYRNLRYRTVCVFPKNALRYYTHSAPQWGCPIHTRTTNLARIVNRWHSGASIRLAFIIWP